MLWETPPIQMEKEKSKDREPNVDIWMPWLEIDKVHLKKLKTISSIAQDKMSPSFELSLSYPLANAIVYSDYTEGKHNPIIFLTTFSPYV